MYQKIGVSAYKKDLTNSLELDNYLSHPHKSYDTIHVAGTNGKGTTCHTIASILQTAGYKVGLYTSPHLKDFRERIKVNGDMITKEEVTSFVSQHKSYLQEHKLSFFEMTVGMAFEIFKKRKVDIAVIETGLGGRLDSTNIITPILSIITSIDKDHTDLLGKTLSKIAVEKAGIIKSGVPVLINEHRPRLRSQFKKIAKMRSSEIYFSQGSRSQNDKSNHIDTQVQNECLAQRAVEILRLRSDYNITDSQITLGISETHRKTGLRGRYELISTNPKVIADVAHNPAGIRSLIYKLQEESFHHLHIVFGAVKGKAIEDVIQHLPKHASYYLCEPNSDRKLSIEELNSKFKEFDLETQPSTSVTNALHYAKIKAEENDLILVTGSTFVVAEIL
ncbi:bifunctional folylpolyglutamate synthase/dihydrofolate synthase [Nonlabens marinus]|uniref:Dihydrofolate synthase/folylpolyglutamate synthase n=1 Tax=Nonlabens marinus S1-08 TaxID=1454201 RepID=W8VVD7_9FLAO|nr:Mur ligase family protein [Nonlabens marinus]BAO55353.1 dihydrofolate synthase [Nonlabens marinus S1-08]